MREIKFRCWDKTDKKWLDPDEFAISSDGRAQTFGVYHPVELSQFTGLQDKNGKDIYGGDILEFESNSGTERCYVDYMGEFASFVIDYWKSGDKASKGDFLHKLVGINETSVEVIGNIHENPELLNA